MYIIHSYLYIGVGNARGGRTIITAVHYTVRARSSAFLSVHKKKKNQQLYRGVEVDNKTPIRCIIQHGLGTPHTRRIYILLRM